jgi:nicotinamide riboside kinase
MSLRVNFFGGPCVGKSTLAAQLFGYLKAEGFDAELVQEFVKTWAYQQRQLKSFDHVYTFASQLHTEDLYLQSGVNIIVTDSPMLLQVMYACMKQLPAASELKHVADAFELAHQSINFLVDRKVEYKPQGRYQTAEAAASIHGTIVNYLDAWHVPYTLVQPGDLQGVIDELDVEYGIRRTKLGAAEHEAETVHEKTVMRTLMDLHYEHGFSSFFSTHQIWLMSDLSGSAVYKACLRLVEKNKLLKGTPTSEGETFAVDAREQQRGQPSEGYTNDWGQGTR